MFAILQNTKYVLKQMLFFALLRFNYISHFHFLKTKLAPFVQKNFFLTFKKPQYPHQTFTPNEFVKV